MSTNPFIIEAWQLDNNQHVEASSVNALKPNLWVHCQRDAEALAPWLLSLGIDQGVIDAVLAEDTRPRFQKLSNDNFLFILRGVNLNPGEQPDDMLSLRVLYYNNALITLRKFPFKAISIVREQLNQGQGASTAIGVLISIIENLHLKVEDVVVTAEVNLDELQEQLESPNTNSQQKLTNLHRQLLRLNRFLKPQTHAFTDIINSQVSFLKDETYRQSMLNQKDVVQRILEEIDSNLEQAWVLREHIQQRLAENMNKNTYRLSLFAGIFLPLGFVTGLLGVNVGGIPGADYAWSFAILCGLMVGVAGIEYLILRRLKYW